jgi:hypothetical protein
MLPPWCLGPLAYQLFLGRGWVRSGSALVEHKIPLRPQTGHLRFNEYTSYQGVTLRCDAQFAQISASYAGRHMASHPSVTRCDVSAPYRHTVTSRHTPLRGVTDVTCDAGGDHRFRRWAYHSGSHGGPSHIVGGYQDFMSISNSITLAGRESVIRAPHHSARTERDMRMFEY